MAIITLGKTDSGGPVTIDLQILLSTRLLVTASSGGGKSETLRRILEESVSHIQCIVIDPEGEFATLREKKPFVLIGEGGEAAADIRTAGLVATRLLELNASAVCDIYEMPVHQRHEWVKRFLSEMVNAPKSLWHPVLVVLDEAHSFAPEKGYNESVALQAVTDMANLGRKRGFALIPATHRLSKLSKNVAEPMQNYLVGRTTFDDQERAARVFKIKPGADTRAFSLELERLRDGQFIARGRAFNGDLLKVQVIRGVTRPPATGSAMAGVVTPTPQAIKALLPKLADIPHEAERKAKSEDDLKRELLEAKRRIRELESAVPVAVEIPVQMIPDPAELAKIGEQMRSEFSALLYEKAGKKWAQELREMSAKIIAWAASAEDESKWQLTNLPKHIETAIQQVPMVRNSAPPRAPVARPDVPAPAVRVSPSRMAHRPQNGHSNLSGPEQRILNAIAWLESIGVDSPEQPAVAFLAGYTYGGGAYNNPRGRLNVNGMIEYVPGDRIRLTETGRIEASYPDLPASNEALHQSVLARLPGPEQRLLSPLLRSYPKPMTNQALADAANYTAGAGAFNNPRGRLKTLGLIEYPQPGMVRAKDLLFPV